MKIGIKKVHESEWMVQIGCASVKMDPFSLSLLEIMLEHLLALEHGESHSTLKSYVKLGLKIKTLPDLECQTFLREVEVKDLLYLMMVADDRELNALILKNLGGILAKQLKGDLMTASVPTEEHAKKAIKRIVEKLFELESHGKIEFRAANTRYI
ncbi:hypothetical protein MNBD_GAMMA04-17 [hydrothermal vent metagenome]|uniref:Flagellar motor switch protein FliG C-terminal domain-containing protein n=1 Tax=hydrothermal vent metagenome TaxID=652676 RepID=A0A3B0VZS4_9ZZZZ